MVKPLPPFLPFRTISQLNIHKKLVPARVFILISEQVIPIPWKTRKYKQTKNQNFIIHI